MSGAYERSQAYLDLRGAAQAPLPSRKEISNVNQICEILNFSEFESKHVKNSLKRASKVLPTPPSVITRENQVDSWKYNLRILGNLSIFISNLFQPTRMFCFSFNCGLLRDEYEPQNTCFKEIC